MKRADACSHASIGAQLGESVGVWEQHGLPRDKDVLLCGS